MQMIAVIMSFDSSGSEDIRSGFSCHIDLPSEQKTSDKKTTSHTTSTRIRFIWTRSLSAPYLNLSRNIVREVCQYLGEPSELLYYSNKVMYRAYPASRTSEPFFEVNYMLGRGNVDAAVFLDREEVFMVMRDSTSAYEDFPYYMMFRDDLRSVPGCRNDRFMCSLIYDQRRGCIYIFGGHEGFQEPNSHDSKVCEKFLPSDLSLERLPDMLQPRSAFGLCWHKDCVYLCGGSHNSIEQFNPNTLLYTTMGEVTADISYPLAFSYEGCLYLLGCSAVWKEEGGGWKRIGRVGAQEQSNWWPYPFFVSIAGNYCHFIAEDLGVSLDMRTFTETSFPISQ